MGQGHRHRGGQGWRGRVPDRARAACPYDEGGKRRAMTGNYVFRSNEYFNKIKEGIKYIPIENNPKRLYIPMAQKEISTNFLPDPRRSSSKNMANKINSII